MRTAGIGAVLPLVVGLLVATGGCTCPKGNAVTASRDVAADFQLVTATQTYTGHATSPPSGQGIAYDRATIPTLDSPTAPARGTNLALYTMSPGCHPDATGTVVCDWAFAVAVTIPGVGPSPALPLTIALDDATATVRVDGTPPPILGPCPGKPDTGSKCPVVTDASTDDGTDSATYTGLQGQVTLTQLAEDCTDVLSICALTAAGTLQLTATGPNGEALSLSAGTIAAADTLTYQATCAD